MLWPEMPKHSASCSPCPVLGPSAPSLYPSFSISLSLRRDLVEEAEVCDWLFSSSSLKHVSKLQSACKKMELLNELMDRGGNYVAAALPFVVSLLARGLAGRALLVAHSLPQTPEVTQWAVTLNPLLLVGSCTSLVALLGAGRGFLLTGEEVGLSPLCGNVGPGARGAAGMFGLGRSCGPAVGQGEGSRLSHWEAC